MLQVFHDTDFFFFFLTPFKLVIDDSIAMTPFYLLLGKHRHQQQENLELVSSPSAERIALPQSSVAIKEVGSLTVYSLACT